jgi:hypothetical protein
MTPTPIALACAAPCPAGSCFEVPPCLPGRACKRSMPTIPQAVVIEPDAERVAFTMAKPLTADGRMQVVTFDRFRIIKSPVAQPYDTKDWAVMLGYRELQAELRRLG